LRYLGTSVLHNPFNSDLDNILPAFHHKQEKEREREGGREDYLV